VKNQDEDLELLPLEQDPSYINGYCEHGWYVGGCGVDWMCPWCEDGISRQEFLQILKDDALYKIRNRARNVQMFITISLSMGYGGIETMEMARNIQ
jgi:hypothetical protein